MSIGYNNTWTVYHPSRQRDRPVSRPLIILEHIVPRNRFVKHWIPDRGLAKIKASPVTHTTRGTEFRSCQDLVGFSTICSMLPQNIYLRLKYVGRGRGGLHLVSVHCESGLLILGHPLSLHTIILIDVERSLDQLVVVADIDLVRKHEGKLNNFSDWILRQNRPWIETARGRIDEIWLQLLKQQQMELYGYGSIHNEEAQWSCSLLRSI